jgi:hypothetical protein
MLRARYRARAACPYMQGAQKLRSEAHLQVRRNDEVEAQRSRSTFYETIKTNTCTFSPKDRLCGKISGGVRNILDLRTV